MTAAAVAVVGGGGGSRRRRRSVVVALVMVCWQQARGKRRAATRRTVGALTAVGFLCVVSSFQWYSHCGPPDIFGHVSSVHLSHTARVSGGKREKMTGGLASIPRVVTPRRNGGDQRRRARSPAP